MDMAETDMEGLEKREPAGQSLSSCAALFSRERIGSVSAERVPTGFPSLDRSLNGGLFNGLFVLGAVPGLGKSTLALQIAYNLSGRGYPVLYFALEMNRAWITAKALCRADFALHRQPGFQAADLLSLGKQFSDGEWERINQARELVEREGQNLYLYEQGPELTHIGQIRPAHPPVPGSGTRRQAATSPSLWWWTTCKSLPPGTPLVDLATSRSWTTTSGSCAPSVTKRRS